jgi:hypothetical protein
VRVSVAVRTTLARQHPDSISRDPETERERERERESEEDEVEYDSIETTQDPEASPGAAQRWCGPPETCSTPETCESHSKPWAPHDGGVRVEATTADTCLCLGATRAGPDDACREVRKLLPRCFSSASSSGTITLRC